MQNTAKKGEESQQQKPAERESSSGHTAAAEKGKGGLKVDSGKERKENSFMKETERRRQLNEFNLLKTTLKSEDRRPPEG